MSQTAELIKRLRAKRLSQSEIARRTGIPQPRLSRWENGEAPESADDALKLKALVEALDALGDTGGGPTTAPGALEAAESGAA